MTTTEFLLREAPVGTGAGGDSPRRLIPSGFQPIDVHVEPRHWTGSPLVVAALLLVVALASLAAGLVLTKWSVGG